jgi:hypothetical protein
MKKTAATWKVNVCNIQNCIKYTFAIESRINSYRNICTMFLATFNK